MASDGLETIVMLGEQIELTYMIDIATQDLETAQAEHESKILSEEYNDASNEKSPNFYIERIKSTIRRDDGRAGKVFKIEQRNGRKRNPSVSDYTYIQFTNLTSGKSRDELIVDFDRKYQELEIARNGTSQIVTLVPKLPEVEVFSNFDKQTVNELLQRTIEPPELSEREKYLINLVHDNHGHELQLTAQEFSNSQLVRCPKCHQPLTDQYKTELISSIKKFCLMRLKSINKI